MWKWIRVFAWGVITLLFMLCLVCAGLQTGYAKKKLLALLVEAGNSHGICLEVGALKGGPPLRWALENIRITLSPDEKLEIPELRFSIRFLPLLRGELALKRVVVRDLSYTFSGGGPLKLPVVDLPFTLSCKQFLVDNATLHNTATKEQGVYSLRAKGKLAAHSTKFWVDIFLSTPSVAEAFAHFYSSGSQTADAVHCRLSCNLPSMEPLSPLFVSNVHAGLSLNATTGSEWNRPPLNGELTANILFQDPHLQGDVSIEGVFTPAQGNLRFKGNHLIVNDHVFQKCQGELTALFENTHWEGKTVFQVEQDEIVLGGASLFEWRPLEVNLTHARLEGNGLAALGELQIGFSPFRLQGNLSLRVDDLTKFSKWAPEEELSGSLAIGLKFEEDDTAECTLVAKEFRSAEVAVQDLQLAARLTSLWETPQGEIGFEGGKVHFSSVSLDTLSFNTQAHEGVWDFKFKTEGFFKTRLACALSGSYEKTNTGQTLSFHDAQGTLLTRSFHLEKPFASSWGETEILITPWSIVLGPGTCSGSAHLTPHRSEILVKADHFPLDLLALSAPEFTLAGSCSLDLSLKEEGGPPSGRVHLLLEEATISQSGKPLPIRAKGNLQLNLDRNALQLHSDLKASGGQFFEWTATLPVQGNLFSYTLRLDQEQPLASQVTMEGKLEEIFDFINIGSHKVAGLVSCHLYLSKTLLSPSLVGKIYVQQGRYDNYVTGTSLQEITASGSAENNQFTLTSFQGKGKEEGSLSAQGEMRLDFKEHFPYAVTLQLDNLSTLRYDSFWGNFTGPLKVTGTTQRAYAEGALLVSEGHFQIPDKLPLDIPVLPVTYIHQPPHLQKNLILSPPLFPTGLDIYLSAGNKIFVRGRGLNSEWNGQVHLGGDNSDLSANGSLQLLKGEFAFSGKVFSLTQGEISFAHKNTQEAFLSLSGTLNLSDATITALLRGPLSSPQLSLYSVPHMPTSSILARILFNKDISEISALQAIQIAQAIVTLSGGAGPDVLEAIRKSLGIDRLNIVSSQSGSDEISVQIGKYLTRGVMVTLSQSADSSQVIVEVELSRGFVFQAETQEEEEGKFTLKWNRNY